MVQLKRSEQRVIDDAMQMGSGYVLDFSDRTMGEFFEDEFGIDIHADKYQINGVSKAKKLRALVEIEDANKVSIVLRKLWEYRKSMQGFALDEAICTQRDKLFELLANLEGAEALPCMDAIDRFKRDETLEELISAIHRDITANKPAAALDRLHTYCMKKFGHLLDQRSIDWDRSDALHSRVGKYVKALNQERELREITHRVVRSSISVFEAFNDVRNNRSFAHDNDLVDQSEARFIFDAVSSFLRFLKNVDGGRFGA